MNNNDKMSEATLTEDESLLPKESEESSADYIGTPSSSPDIVSLNSSLATDPLMQQVILAIQQLQERLMDFNFVEPTSTMEESAKTDRASKVQVATDSSKAPMRKKMLRKGRNTSTVDNSKRESSDWEDLQDSKPDKNNRQKSDTCWKIVDTLKKFEVKYGGTPEEPVHNFIDAVSDVKNLLSVRDKDLLDCLTSVLKSRALMWYRMKNFDTWDNAKEAFLKHFAGPLFHRELENYMRTRKQKENESVMAYFHSYRTIFWRLNYYVPESEQVYMTYMNLLPELKRAINVENIETLDDLELKALELEMQFQLQKEENDEGRKI